VVNRQVRGGEKLLSKVKMKKMTIRRWAFEFWSNGEMEVFYEVT
jgi:hypothetical protein